MLEQNVEDKIEETEKRREDKIRQVEKEFSKELRPLYDGAVHFLKLQQHTKSWWLR